MSQVRILQQAPKVIPSGSVVMQGLHVAPQHFSDKLGVNPKLKETTMMKFLLNLLFGSKAQQFNSGDKVNSIDLHAGVNKTDGYVMGVSGNVAVVKWPKAGITNEDTGNLCRIVA